MDKDKLQKEFDKLNMGIEVIQEKKKQLVEDNAKCLLDYEIGQEVYFYNHNSDIEKLGTIKGYKVCDTKKSDYVDIDFKIEKKGGHCEYINSYYFFSKERAKREMQEKINKL